MMKRIGKICVCLAIVCLVLPGMVCAAEHRGASYYMLQMINDVRNGPASVLEGAEIDMTMIRGNLGMDAWIIDSGLPPLAWNERLYDSALAHANDMIANLYYAYESRDGTTVQERIEATGYRFVHTGESLGVISFERYIDPIEAAENLFVNMLAYELSAGVTEESRNILNDNRTEVGVAFVSAIADLGFALPVNIYLVVADFATPFFSRTYILGNVATKAGTEGVFQLEHALSGMHLKLKELSTGRTVDTLSGETGFYQFQSVPGFLMLEIWNREKTVLHYRQPVSGREQNQRLDLFIDD